MRTTVTLEPDVAAMLREFMRERGLSKSEAINALLRSGMQRFDPERKPFEQRTFAMGPHPLSQLDKALGFSDAIADAELILKLSQQT